MNEDAKKDARREFRKAVNMAPRELENWLNTEEARSVGQASGDGESVGHQMGKRIVEIKRTKADDLTEEDYKAMNKVVGYVNRHLKQGGPKKNTTHSKWRYSLMNWGHDPLKD